MRVRMTPRPGIRVLYPAGSPLQGQALPADGAMVEPSSYWRRRILDGDVVEGDLPPDKATKAPTKGKE